MKIVDIDNAIILHDVKQIRKEPPMQKVKNIHKLCKAIKKQNLTELSIDALQAKLYRINGKKHDERDRPFIDIILKVLEIEEKEVLICV